MSLALLLASLVALAVLVFWLMRRWRSQTSSIAAAPPPGQLEHDNPVDEDNVDDRLIELDNLLAQGQITRTEYETRRKDLLKSV